MPKKASNKRSLLAIAGVAAALVLSACGGSDDGDSGGSTDAGDPVVGGTATIMQYSEPRRIDPAILSNSWVINSAVGNAIYGTLLTNDTTTGEIQPSMAELTTDDHGQTFTLTLREGLKFSDGTPFTAADVKFGWDRITDPATGATGLQAALMIDETEVVDDRTLKITLVSQFPNFGQSIVFSQLNWIGKAEALQAGPDSFEANPIGAGPFVLTKWARQDVMEFDRNEHYWDAPKPYLDKLIVRTHNDTNGRWNALQSGGVNGIIDSDWVTINKAEQADFAIDRVTLNGGNLIAFNQSTAPFDDVRARQAVSMALDTEAINSAVFQGHSTTPKTLMFEESPLFTDVALHEHNPEKAQELFDELAAEGKPVSFSFLAYPTAENRGVAESVQAQLAAFKNVTAEVEVGDFATIPARVAQRDYQVIVSGPSLTDPDPALWNAFHSTSQGNQTVTNDPAMDAALLKGRLGETVDERKEAYREVAERMRDLAVGVYYTATVPVFISDDKLMGAKQYGSGSLLPGELWLKQ